MLDKDLFINEMENLLTLFPNWQPDFNNPDTVRKWYERFTDLNDNEFKSMVDDFILNEKFHPTVGGLRQYIVKEHRKSRDQIEHENMLKENGLI